MKRSHDDEAPLAEGGGPGRLEVAAAVEGRTHIAGIGWRVTLGSRPGPVRAETRRYGRSLIFSELSALRGGLREVSRSPVSELTVRIPDRRAVALFRGDDVDRFPAAAREVDRLRPTLERFGALRFEPEFVPDPELVHAVAEALDAGLHAAAEREEHRSLVMERIMERARSVQLERGPGGWLANGRYRVSLDPMRCECPAWTARWSRAPIAGRRAQRLPCKHIVALALVEGVRVPAELSELARKVPY